MPISKRALHTATAHAPPSVLSSSSEDSAIGDLNMARSIGAIQQINNLAMYAAEIFDNISRLSEDTCGRLRELTVRTSSVIKMLPAVEARVLSTTIAVSETDVMKTSHASRKATSIPTVLTKRTNCPQISALYDKCSLPPQLWKLESVIPEDCMMNYSDPGFFFKEWLKQEQERQEEQRRERKKTKEIKRTAKLERRKQRQAQNEAAVEKSDNRKSLRRTVSLPTKPTPRASVAMVTTDTAATITSASNASTARTLFNTPMGVNPPPRTLPRQSTVGMYPPSSMRNKAMPPLLSLQTPSGASASIAYSTPTMRLFSMEEEMRQDGVDPHLQLLPPDALPPESPATTEQSDGHTPTPPPIEDLYGAMQKHPFSSLPQSHSSLDGVAPPGRKKSILMRSATALDGMTSSGPLGMTPRSLPRGSVVGGAPMNPPDSFMVTPASRKRQSIIQSASFSRSSSGLTSMKAPARVMMRSSVSFRKMTAEEAAALGPSAPGPKMMMTHPKGSVSGPINTSTTVSSAQRSRLFDAGNTIKEDEGDDELHSFDSRQGVRNNARSKYTPSDASSDYGGSVNDRLKPGVPSFMTHYSTFDMSPPALDPAASTIIYGEDKFKLDPDDAWYRSGADAGLEPPPPPSDSALITSRTVGSADSSDRASASNRSVPQRKPSIGATSASNSKASDKKSSSKPSAPPTLGFGSVLDFLPPDLAYLKDYQDENEFYESNLGFHNLGSSGKSGSSNGDEDDLPPPPDDEYSNSSAAGGGVGVGNEYTEYEHRDDTPATLEADHFIDEFGNEGYFDPEGRPYYLASDGNYYYYEDTEGGAGMDGQGDGYGGGDAGYYNTEEVQQQRMGMLDAIRNGGQQVQLRQAVPIERRVDVRQQLMSDIRDGLVALKPTTVNVKTNVEQKHEAIAAILSNRTKIAGSDSDSSDSDSDFSDDDYF